MKSLKNNKYEIHYCTPEQSIEASDRTLCQHIQTLKLLCHSIPAFPSTEGNSHDSNTLSDKHIFHAAVFLGTTHHVFNTDIVKFIKFVETVKRFWYRSTLSSTSGVGYWRFKTGSRTSKLKSGIYIYFFSTKFWTFIFFFCSHKASQTEDLWASRS